jgi:hypothetical protein
MKAPPSRSGNVLRGQLQEPNQKRKPPMKTKRERFDTLVARYYPAVYRFASRLTDDPREAVFLTHDAFNSARKQVRSHRDEVARVTILLTAVIRAGLTAAWAELTFHWIGGKMARLVLISEGVDFATHEFIDDIVFIGRTPVNRIVIDHSTVSAQHALLLRVGDSYWLKDLNSTNGTQINGVSITDTELKDGDTIQFGSVLAVFEAGCRKPSSSRGAKMFGMNISV